MLKLPLHQLIERLESIRGEVGDFAIECRVIGIEYVHAVGKEPHRIEFWDEYAKDRDAETLRKLRYDLERAQNELKSYKDAYG